MFLTPTPFPSMLIATLDEGSMGDPSTIDRKGEAMTRRVSIRVNVTVRIRVKG